MRQTTTLLLMLFFAANELFSQCAPATGSAFLDVNNVSARMNMGGSNWWDELGSAQYEVPAGEGVHCFFTGSFWIGGLDPVDGLHLSAVRFRQVGDDYWPGPLNSDGQIDSITCTNHDRIYKLNRWQVEEFIQRVNEAGYVIPQDILEWPAEGNIFTDVNAKAPFIDVNENGIYEPTLGDYPAFAINEPTEVDFHLMGDQCLWWVENDMGNMHTETGGEPLGIEIQSMAYAFTTCNELNEQTFYRKKVINKSHIDYHDTYTGVWVDADLGFAQDDYVQCHVMKNLGFAYNGFNVDGTGGPQHYGAHPPSAGICLLEGALANPNDGVDNDRDGVVDEPGEHLKMSRFIYHNNNGGGNPVHHDPNTALDYYNYMKGVWMDGSPMCYGGSGHPSGGCDTGLEAAFMFPGDSDPLGYGTGGVPAPTWTEQTAGNVPLDRRFLLSSGPFTFNAEDTIHVHYGALWARDTISQEVYASNEALYDVTDMCQQAFDSNFENQPCCPPVADIHLFQSGPDLFFFSAIDNADEYFWDFGDGTTSTERFPPAHTYGDNAIHEVTLIVSNECGSDTAQINAGTIFFNVEEDLFQQGIQVFPNPASDNVFVQLPYSNANSLDALLYSVDGRLMLSKKIGLGSDHVSISLKDVSSGMYYLIISDDVSRFSQKVVVQK